MKHYDSFVCPHKIPPPGKITVAEYPPQSNGFEVYYEPILNRKKDCLICKHFTAPRDLRQQKRYVVQIGKGICRLGEKIKTCTKFERIDELRGKNLSVLEKAYFNYFTREYLNKVVRWYFKNPQLIYNANDFQPKLVADMVVAYEAERRKAKEISNTK